MNFVLWLLLAAGPYDRELQCDVRWRECWTACAKYTDQKEFNACTSRCAEKREDCRKGD